MPDYSVYKNVFFWMFVPGFLASCLQSLYYKLRFSAAAAPRDGQPRHRRDKAWIYGLVIVAYLGYSYIEAETTMAPNYYHTLGLDSRAFTPKELRANFRGLSLKYHPDKLDLGLLSADEAHTQFMAIQKAYNALKIPLTKAAYDAFGAEALDCQECKTAKDYIMDSLFSSYLTFYVGSLIFLGILSLLGTSDFGRYWRFIGLLGLAAAEGSLLLQSWGSDTGLLNLVWGRHPIFQKIILLRQLFVMSFIALSQLGPILWPPPPASRPLRPLIETLERLAGFQGREAASALNAAVEPFAAQPDALAGLKRKIEKFTVDSQLLTSPEYLDAYKRVGSRVVAGAPAAPAAGGGPALTPVGGASAPATMVGGVRKRNK